MAKFYFFLMGFLMKGDCTMTQWPCKFVKFYFFILAGILGTLQPLSGQGIDDNLKYTARTELQSYLEKIPTGLEERYGFHNRQEFSRAIPGDPLRIYSIHPDSIRGEINPGKEYLVAQEEWKVPVLIDGDARALLTVAKVDGKLKVVELGATGLARELGVVGKEHPTDQKIILRLYQLQCDFLVLTPKGKQVSEGYLYPLRSAGLVFHGHEFDVNNLQPVQKALPLIRQKYVDNHWPGGHRDK
jgi:hypothetical protein